MPTLTKKVDDITQIVTEKINNDEIEASQNKSASSKLLEIESDFASKFVDLEAKIASIENGHVLSNDNNENVQYDNEEIQTIKQEVLSLKGLINNLNNQKPSVCVDETLKDEIEEIKEKLNDINKLENTNIDEEKINKINERLIALENKSTIMDNNGGNNYSDVTNLRIELSEIKEKLSNISLSANYQNDINDIWNKIDELNNNDGKTDIQQYEDYNGKIINLENRIQSLEQKSNISVSESNDFDYNKINNDIAEINNKISNIENNQTPNDNGLDSVSYVKYRELELKVAQLEKQLYEVSAEKLSSKDKQTKQNKKLRTQQMSLFDFLPEESENKKDFASDFGSLEKDKEDSIANDTVIDETIETNLNNKANNDNVINLEKTESIEVNQKQVEDTDMAQEISQVETIDFKPTQPKVEENDGIQNVIEEKPQPVINKNELINKYYDEENHSEVINKTNSSIVIKDTSVQENEQNIIVLDESDGLDKFAKYNIHDFEKTMYDAFDIKSKNDKVRVTGIWSTLSKGADPQYYSIAGLLSEGKPEAVGNREIVLSYSNVSKCNEVMRWSFKSKALRYLRSRLGDQYNYIALPIDVWREKRQEYIEQYQMGTKNPKLKPFNIPGLNINELAKENDEEIKKTINKTIDIFGDGIVKVK